MSTKYAKLIKSLRLEKGLSQAFVAEKLNLSRQSYMAVERGTRELTLLEAKTLQELYGISLEELVGAVIPKYEKYKQMILAVLQATSTHRDGKVPKTKLAKLVYLSDFAWYYNNLESMSGMQYLRRAFGPVADPYFRALDELEGEGKITIDHKGDMLLVGLGEGVANKKLNCLDADEKKLIKKIAEKWKGVRTQEIVNFTHNQLPYKLCTSDEVIPYELITQEDPEHVY